MGSDIKLGGFAPARQGFLDDDTAHIGQAAQHFIGKSRVERVQQPAPVVLQQLPESPFLLVPGQHIRAIARQAIGLDDDRSRLPETLGSCCGP